MSLGIVFKGPEGIVLAADSRVTLNAQLPEQSVILPASFDNATKLLKVSCQDYVAAVTYGVGAIGQQEPRTAHSFLPEFEAQLRKKVPRQAKRKAASAKPKGESRPAASQRLGVKEFAQELGDFFMTQWTRQMPADFPPGQDMVFIVGGFDENAPYGRVFEVQIPSRPAPRELQDKAGEFGPVWGGQRELVDRLLQGYDPQAEELVAVALKLTPADRQTMKDSLAPLGLAIPYPFLPLQDCVDLSMFLIRMTIAVQRWQVAIRGVGGAIDVATITKTDGFRPVQLKQIVGESSNSR
jgi:hypothetical protein